MLIADILRDKGAKVQTISSNAPLKEAIKSLATHRIGALIVSHDGQQIDGILSERDLVRALADETVEFSRYTVGDLMTTNVFTTPPDSTLVTVMELMNKNRIRHVPVTIDGSLKGVVSIGDIVKARLKETEMERKELADYIAGSPVT